MARPALSIRDRQALNKYYARMDRKAMTCRLKGQHDVPDVDELGENPNIDIEPVPQQRGVWQVVAYCNRCGAKQTVDIEKGTGYITTRRRTVLPSGYQFTEEDGGDGHPMDRERKAYLRALRLDEAIERKRAMVRKQAGTPQAVGG